MMYIGIDPGDKWCGFAQLTVNRYTYYAEMGVLQVNTTLRLFNELVDVVVPDSTNPLRVICESYQQRTVGHQRFGRGSTLQLIGALRYRTESIGAPFITVQPMSPTWPLLKQLVVGEYLELWQEWWPEPTNAKWAHALSAWRVLAQYLVMQDHAHIRRLRNVGSTVRTADDIKARVLATRYDLIAPVSIWQVPGPLHVMPTRRRSASE